MKFNYLLATVLGAGLITSINVATASNRVSADELTLIDENVSAFGMVNTGGHGTGTGRGIGTGRGQGIGTGRGGRGGIGFSAAAYETALPSPKVDLRN